ncbi:hypothetical protein DYB28_005314, partial [Aphanomyces astaci]
MLTALCRHRVVARALSAAAAQPKRAFGSVAVDRDDQTISAEAAENKYIVKTYNSNGVRTKKGLVITHGKGPYLFDSHGNKYLDFYSGIAVTALGHADPEVARAVADQAA